MEYGGSGGRERQAHEESGILTFSKEPEIVPLGCDECTVSCTVVACAILQCSNMQSLANRDWLREGTGIGAHDCVWFRALIHRFQSEGEQHLQRCI